MSAPDIFELDPSAPDPDTLDQAAAVLRSGGLVAFPTETVYGLGAYGADASARLARAKGRDEGKPFQVLVADAKAAQAAGVFNRTACALAERFWPGPLTLVVPRLDALAGEADTIGLRVPDHAIALGLIERLGGALVATSANRPGALAARTAEAVLAALGQRVELILDGGPVAAGRPSTVVALSGDGLTILREGAIARDRILRVRDARD